MGIMKVSFHIPKPRDVLIATIFLLAIATTFLIIFLVGTKVPKGYIEVVGVIDHIDSEWDVASETYNHTAYVKYTFEGHEYINPLDVYTSSMKVGKAITIYVNPNNPNQITAMADSQVKQTLFIISLVIYGISVGLFGLFIGLLINKKRKKETNEIEKL